MSEEGDIVYTPEQTSLTDQQGTLDASLAVQPNTTPAHNEEIEMIEYLVWFKVIFIHFFYIFVKFYMTVLD